MIARRMRRVLPLAVAIGAMLGGQMGCTSEPEPVIILNDQDSDSSNEDEEHPPVVEISSGPAEVTSEDSAEIEFSCVQGDNCSFECTLDDGEAESCASPVRLEQLADGGHLFSVVAVEDEVRSEAVSWEWTVDTTGPDVVDLDGPSEYTADTEAEFSFGCSKQNCTFECAFDGQPFETCQSGVTYSELADDSYTFSVRAEDSLGNVGATANWEWTVDTVLPLVVDLEGPQEFEDSSSATFDFGCSKPDCEFRCKLRLLSGGTIANEQSCHSGQTYTDLPDEEYVFSVYATDDTDIDGPPAELNWTVDTIPAQIQELSGPADPTSETEASFDFGCSEDDCTFECSLVGEDQGTLSEEETCVPGVAYSGLNDDDYTFRVVSVDPAGNRSAPGEWEWTVDTVGPTVEGVSGPNTPTAETTAEFGYDCSEEACTFECSIFGAASGAVVSDEDCEPGQAYSGFDDDEYTLSVVATDSAGNVGPAAEWSWRVDTTAPQVEIISGPAPVTNETTANFDVDCSETNCTYECTLVGAAAGEVESTDCGSNPEFSGLSDDDYVLDVVVIDEAGNESDMQQWEWTIDTVAPQVEILSGPPSVIVEDSAAFEFGCSEQSCTFECTLTGATQGIMEEGGCNAEESYTGLADDDYTLEVAATDSAGNNGDAQTWEWTIDRGEPEIDLVVDQQANWAIFEFDCINKPWCEFECALEYDFGVGDWEGGPRESCTSPYEVTGLEEGEYRLSIWAEDENGEEGHVDTTWNVEGLEWTSFSVGEDATCGVTNYGTLWCWGDNGLYQLGVGEDTDAVSEPTAVDNESPWEIVDIGGHISCGLRSDSSWWCWGDQTGGSWGTAQLTSDTPRQMASVLDATWIDTSAGDQYACALRDDGTIWCFGWVPGVSSISPYSPEQPWEGDNWSSLHSGVNHMCAIKNDGTLWCWGQNLDGRLGLGDTESRSEPHQVGLADDWASVSLSNYHTCGIRTDNTLWCWGQSSDGKLGIEPDVGDRLAPVQVDANTDWVDVDTARNHTCATREDGQMFCWGDGQEGRLGGGDLEDAMTPSPVVEGTNWTDVETFETHSCALDEDQQMSCWGSNFDGQLGIGEFRDKDAPTSLDVSKPFVDLAVRDADGCGIDIDGALWCWGSGEYYEHGLGQIGLVQSPQQVGDDQDWERVDIGDDHGCAIRTDGTLWCWGRGNSGRLGHGEATHALTPVQVGEETDWMDLDVGSEHSCGLREGGKLWCWGRGSSGRLGTGSSWIATIPIEIEADETWISISAGDAHSCAVRDDYTLWCWGDNSDGMLGDGSTTTQYSPSRVGLDSDWLRVFAGDRHTCGLREDDTLWCWGSNADGRLGVGDVGTQMVPVQVDGDSQWSSVDLGGDHSCAIREDGTLWCWGVNQDGQLGIGEETESVSLPSQVGDGDDWFYISAGRLSTVGLRGAGDAQTWGNNLSGRLGDGRSWHSVPIPVLTP